jgi:hypothetical protein
VGCVILPSIQRPRDPKRASRRGCSALDDNSFTLIDQAVFGASFGAKIGALGDSC